MRPTKTLDKDNKFGYLATFCNNCGKFEIITDNSRTVPVVCDCHYVLSDIDYGMLYVARTLYSCGISISNCCEGHFKEGYHHGYIDINISRLSSITGITRKEFKIKYGHPVGWNINSLGEMVGDIDEFNIEMNAYIKMFPLNENKFNEYKEIYMKNLYDWVDMIYTDIHGTPNDICKR